MPTKQPQEVSLEARIRILENRMKTARDAHAKLAKKHPHPDRAAAHAAKLHEADAVFREAARELNAFMAQQEANHD